MSAKVRLPTSANNMSYGSPDDEAKNAVHGGNNNDSHYDKQYGA